MQELLYVNFFEDLKEHLHSNSELIPNGIIFDNSCSISGCETQMPLSRPRIDITKEVTLRGYLGSFECNVTYDFVFLNGILVDVKL